MVRVVQHAATGLADVHVRHRQVRQAGQQRGPPPAGDEHQQHPRRPQPSAAGRRPGAEMMRKGRDTWTGEPPPPRNWPQPR